MKTYSIDFTKISEAVNSLNSAESLIANDCIDASKERIEEARKLLQEFMNQDNLADGLVSKSEAEAAIKEAVKKAENAQKNAIDAMVQLCKSTNAAKTTMSAKRPDGYIYETVIRKDGAVAYDEFSKEQLQEIRERFANSIYQRGFESEAGAEKEILHELSKKDLEVINVCQARLEKGGYSSLEDFLHKQKDI